MNHLKDIFLPVLLKETEDVKIEACVVDIYMAILSNAIKVDVLLDTKTPFNSEGHKEVKTIDISNENKIQVYTSAQTPKHDVDGNKVFIGEMDMWLKLMGQYTLKQCMQLIQQSMQREFGLIQTPFIYIEE
ncbi:hypothetical protein [Bernardetia sp.]|uniref:hypothetical protein n=1 Tax=Bernardetia sp. TaxID=1937974 RepID=UPI0025C3C2BF|nr:hypothetical protein [Bernardetia sp.]